MYNTQAGAQEADLFYFHDVTGTVSENTRNVTLMIEVIFVPLHDQGIQTS